MSPTSIAQLWQDVHDWAEANQPQRLLRLNPAASDEDLAALAALELPLPQDFLQSVRIHDGEDADVPGRLFPGGASLLPAQEIIATREQAISIEDEFPDGPDEDDEAQPRVGIGAVKPWADTTRRLPFMRQDEFLWLLDFDPAEGGTVGQVIRCDAAGRSDWMVCADSFTAFLSDYLDALRAGEVEAEDFDALDAELVDEGDEEDEGLFTSFLDEDEADEEYEDSDDQRGPEPWPPIARLPWLQPETLTPERLRTLGQAGHWTEAWVLSGRLNPALPWADSQRLQALALREQGHNVYALRIETIREEAAQRLSQLAA